MERTRAFDVVAAALQCGIRFFDTADVYAPDDRSIGHNEILVREAVEDAGFESGAVVIATKGGLERKGKRWTPNGRASFLEGVATASLRRLDGGALDLFQWHAPDPKVELGTSARALRSLLDQEITQAVGVCNLGRPQLETALEHVELACLQVALSPLDLSSVKSGAIPLAIERGLIVIAHTPLGGTRSKRRLERSRFADIARRIGVSPQQVALAWLRGLNPSILPIPGATTVEHVEANVQACGLELASELLDELDEEIPAAAFLRRGCHSHVDDRSQRKVVLIVGHPAAGKTTYTRGLERAGFERLSRDDRGGQLRHLLAPLERRLRSDPDAKVLLDATYPTRAARFDVVELARRLGAAIECHWLRTTLEQAQIQAVLRLLERYGRLPEPDELATLGREDPGCFPPSAQFSYQRKLEEPRDDEGFGLVSVEPPALELRWGDRSALFVDDSALATKQAGPTSDDRLGELESHYDQTIVLSYRPGSTDDGDAVREKLPRYVCTHPPGPAVCWCRKPLPGLALLALREHQLDASRCAILASSPADRTLGRRLGIEVLDL